MWYPIRALATPSLLCLGILSWIAAAPFATADELNLIDNPSALQGARYSVTFCARSKPNLGHAFVLWERVDPIPTHGDLFGFGFYPKEGVGVLGEVPGSVVDEVRRGSLGSELVTFRVAVSQLDFDASSAVVESWRGRPYSVAESDCVSFVADVAKRLDLIVPSRSGLDSLPAKFVAELNRMNSDASAGLGAWTVTSGKDTFRLVIRSSSAVVLQTRNGNSLARTAASISRDENRVVVNLANDEKVLSFYGFSQKTVAEVLKRGAPESRFELAPKGTPVSGKWFALKVTSPDGNFVSMGLEDRTVSFARPSP